MATELSQSTASLLRSAGAYLADLAVPTVRLGVTGLSRSGKTVFIAALVRNLVREGRLPFFGPAAEGRIVRAYLEPQPDDDVPRFAYEEHLAMLARDPAEWPESTRRISQLRVTVEYVSRGALWRALGVNRLHIDIVDYPGEWLIDIALMNQTYREWCEAALVRARDPRRAVAAGPFLAFLAQAGEAGDDEQTAIRGAGLFTAYLRAARIAGPHAGAADPTLGPGRFLLPGDLEGSPLLTFFPLDAAGAAGSGLERLLARRFEAYKARVVKPFFRDHFARLDRQIVLVDALSAVDAGGPALADLEASLAAVLKAFRPGAQSWLGFVLPRRIDRILFAATKADHLNHASHDRLEALLGELTRRASERAVFAGAQVRTLALSALRATREAEVTQAGETLACIVGIPLPGERIGGDVFDGARSAAIFPGDLPADIGALIAGRVARAVDEDMRVIRFRPPRIAPDGPSGAASAWPHIRLDRALDFLIGDRLA